VLLQFQWLGRQRGAGNLSLSIPAILTF
jgi:hypothetical protein